MDVVQKFMALVGSFYGRWIGDGGEGIQCDRELASPDEFGIVGGILNVLLVAESTSTAAKNLV